MQKLKIREVLEYSTNWNKQDGSDRNFYQKARICIQNTYQKPNHHLSSKYKNKTIINIYTHLVRKY